MGGVLGLMVFNERYQIWFTHFMQILQKRISIVQNEEQGKAADVEVALRTELRCIKALLYLQVNVKIWFVQMALCFCLP